MKRTGRFTNARATNRLSKNADEKDLSVKELEQAMMADIQNNNCHPKL
jgi:hypothetical protein